jgi:hypothetical protein
VFGGLDNETGLELESAFELGFSREQCLSSWEKIGAAPLTCKCLSKPQVRKLLDLDKDYALLVNSVQEANEYAVYALTEGGYDGSALQALVLIRPTKTRMIEGGPIMERMSQEQIELLAKVNTHGKKFFATGGSHVCSDDFLKHMHFLQGKRNLGRN